MITTEELARRLKRTVSAITKDARKGHFREAVHRGSRGEYLFDWPEALEAWTKNVDLTRVPVEKLPPAPAARRAPRRSASSPTPQAPTTPAARVVSVVYESERGRLEITPAQYLALVHSDEHPDEALLTDDDCKLIERILYIGGAIDAEGKATPGNEATP